MKYTPKHLKKSALRLLSGNWFAVITCYFAYSIISYLLSQFVSINSISVKLSDIANISAYAKPLFFILILSYIFIILLSPFKVGFIRSVITLQKSGRTYLRQIFANTENWPSIMLCSFIRTSLVAFVSAYPFYSVLTTNNISGIVLAVWFLLLVVIKVEFAFLDFVLADNNISAVKAIIQNRRLLKKHRWHIINLTVSFIPWAVLCAATLGIFSFLLEIYYFSTVTVLYTMIKNENSLDITL